MLHPTSHARGNSLQSHSHRGNSLQVQLLQNTFFLRSITHGSTLLYPSFTNVGLQKGKEGEKQAREG